MTHEEVQMMAFQMIASAGDALDYYYRAIIAHHNGETSDANELLQQGDKKMNECHLLQTQLVQRESSGETIPYSLIMTHAQDHYTTGSNWQRIASLMIHDLK